MLKPTVPLLARAAALGTVAGLRSMMAPALFSREAARSGVPALDDWPLDILALKPVAGALTVLAIGEIAADKLPFMPARTQLPSVLFRAVSGAAVGAAILGSEEQPLAAGAAAGVLGAVAGTFGGYWARRLLGERLPVPDAVLGLVEDGVATGAGLLALRAVPHAAGSVESTHAPAESRTGTPAHHLDASPAEDGVGPLLQRDYGSTIQGSHLGPEQVIARLLEDFPKFSPEELARFRIPAGTPIPLSIGAEMEVYIRGAGTSHVRIVEVADRSLTMQTLDDHPESGWITFAADHDRDGDLVFRIHSRARAADAVRLVGYHLLGKAVQTEIWTRFIQQVAMECGGQIRGEVRIETQEVAEALEDCTAGEPTLRS